MSKDLKITHYEPWMKPQVLSMFHEEYGIEEAAFERFISQLYEHPFQREKCIRLVALDGEKVAGFQSFFYWPYTMGDKTYESFQSGNTLVGKDYRGQGLFQKLINHVFANEENIKADFMMGFPVEASFKGFVKNKWQNILNLKWYVRIMNPAAVLFPIGMNKKFTENYLPDGNKTDRLRLTESQEFVEWKNGLKSEANKYYYFTAEVATNKKITFELRLQTRKRIIKELIIGKIFFDQDSEVHLAQAIKNLLKSVRKSLSVSMISIAVNDECKNPNYSHILVQSGFRKIENEIHFIVRPLREGSENLTNAGLWDISRADIDTW